MSLALALFLVSVTLHGAPSHFAYQGQIVKPNGAPLEASNVQFTIDILSHGAERCLLYQERHTVNMTNSNGIFAIEVGSGARSGTDYEDTNTLANALSNSTGLVTPTTCASVGTYNPSATHGRKLRVTFNDGSGSVTLSQLHNIVSVPYATNASTIDGLTVGDLLTINTSGTYVLTQANLENLFDTPNHNELLALIAGTSTNYLQATPSADFDMNSNKIVNVDTPTAGTDAANKNYVDANLGGMTLDTADIQALAVGNAGEVLTWNGTQWVSQTVSTTDATKLPLAGGTMSGTLDMNNNDIIDVNNINASSTAAGVLTALDATFSNDLTVGNHITASGDIHSNGSIHADGSLSANGDITSSGEIKAHSADFLTTLNVGANLTVTNNVSITGGIGVGTGINSGGTISLTNGSEINFRDADDSNFVGFAAPAIVGADLVWTLPAADGTPNQVLQTDGSGMLNWVSLPSAGEVNTASNVGAGGVAVYKQKTGVDFEFRSVNAGSAKVTITNDAGNNEIDINVDEAQFALGTIPNTPAGNIAATNAQAAINELDTEKVATTRTVGTAADSGLTGGGDLSANRSLSLDIPGTTDLGAVADNADSLLIYDASGSVIREVTRAQFNLSETEVDAMVANNGYADDADKVDRAGDTMTGVLNIDNEQELRLSENDANGAEYVGFKAPAAVGANAIWTLPAADGTVGQVLSTNGAGVLSWVSQASGSDNLGDHTATADLGMANFSILNLEGGSASAPGLSFNGDANTGLFSGGADTLSLTTAGNEALAIGATGNVGIGTSSTSSLLEVNKNHNGSTILMVNNPNAGAAAIAEIGFSNDLGFRGGLYQTSSNYLPAAFSNQTVLEGDGAGVTIFSAAGNIKMFAGGSGAADERLTVTSSGNIGISDANPGAKLSISAPSLNKTFPSPGTGKGSLHIDPESTTDGYSNAITFGANNGVSPIQSAQAGIYVQSAAAYGTIMHLATTDNYGTGAKVQMTLSSEGNVGIGTTNPSQKLDVEGRIVSGPRGTAAGNGGSIAFEELAANGTATVGFRAPDDVTAGVIWQLPAADGTTGQVLQTDGSGVLSWVAQSSGADNLGNHTATANLGMGNHSLINLAGGSAGAPGLSFNGDSNTGVYSATPDTLSFSTAGAEGLVIGATGNVGIGSATPGSRLDVGGWTGRPGTIASHVNINNDLYVGADGANVGRFRFSSNHDVGFMQWNRYYTGVTSAQINTARPSYSIGMNGLSDEIVFDRSPAGSATLANLMTIKGTGSVGIGTGTPGTKLEVEGAITSGPKGTAAGDGGSIIFEELVANGTAKVGFRAPDDVTTGVIWQLPPADGTSGYVLRTNGAGVLSWVAQSSGADHLGNHTATTDLEMADNSILNLEGGTAAAPGLSFNGDANTGLFSAGADSLSLSTAGNEVLTITPAGNIGIGTAGPTDEVQIVKNQNATTYLSIANPNAGVNAESGFGVGNDIGDIGYLFTGASNYITANYRDRLSLYADENNANGINIVAAKSNADIRLYTGGLTDSEERVRLTASGNLGIGTTSPRAALDVNGAIAAAPAVTDTAGTVNFAGSNFAYTSSNCGAFILHNMKDGATYTFAVQGTAVQTCSFTAFSGAGTGALNVRMPPGHGPTTTLTETLYSFVVIGSKVYVSWIPGY